MAELAKDASPVVLSGEGFSAPQSIEVHMCRRMEMSSVHD